MSLSLKATQADGYYQPPDYDAQRHGTLNKINKTHRLGKKASRIREGIVVVRFEMPFKVWCLGCDEIISKGVRFDARKKTVGHFHSTPILEFSMTCLNCHEPIVIRTDPESTEYVCHSGCRLRVETYDPESVGGWKFRSVEELKEVEENPLLQAQARVIDAVKTKDETARIKSIMAINEVNWRDDAEHNKELRRMNRVGRGPLPKPGDRNFILPEPNLTESEIAAVHNKFQPETAGSKCVSDRVRARKLRKLVQKSMT